MVPYIPCENWRKLGGIPHCQTPIIFVIIVSFSIVYSCALSVSHCIPHKMLIPYLFSIGLLHHVRPQALHRHSQQHPRGEQHLKGGRMGWMGIMTMMMMMIPKKPRIASVSTNWFLLMLFSQTLGILVRPCEAWVTFLWGGESDRAVKAAILNSEAHGPPRVHINL